MKKLMFILLLSGCSTTDPKLLQLQNVMVQLVPAHNKVITCIVEAKKFEDVTPCLKATPTPIPTPEKK